MDVFAAQLLAMGRFLDRLRASASRFELEETENGFVLAGEGEGFDALVRGALEQSGEDFVALPVPRDGHYEGLVIVRI